VTLFESLEDDRRELADPRGMRRAYLDEMQAFCEGLRRDLLEGGVGYQRVYTRTPLETTVFDFFRQGR